MHTIIYNGYRVRHPQVSLDAANDGTGEDFRENVPEQRPTPSESLQMAERAEAVRDAVRKLPEELRTPLILADCKELSHTEIAEILACSPKAVETRIYRPENSCGMSLDGSYKGFEVTDTQFTMSISIFYLKVPARDQYDANPVARTH